MVQALLIKRTRVPLRTHKEPAHVGIMADSEANARLDMERLLGEVAALAKTVEHSERGRLVNSLHSLAISLEDSQDTAQRILYSQLPLTITRIGCDLQLFDLLQGSKQPMTAQELSAQLKVAPELMARLLRYMAATQLICEVGADAYAANNVTATFATPAFRGGVYHYFDYMGRGFRHFPDYLRNHGYKNIEGMAESPVLEAWHSDTSNFFQHYQSQKELFTHFNQYMAVQRLGKPSWLEVYPYLALAEGLAAEQPLFVDVGGGLGHQSIVLRKALPILPNKIVVQDLPSTLAQAARYEGIEFVAHDFFHLQPIQGARAYYLRNIIHDFTDTKAVEILKNLRAALDPNSVILVDDMFLPARSVPWQAAQLDISMMIGPGAIERTEKQWHTLMSAAGLKINKVYKYSNTHPDSIIECIPA